MNELALTQHPDATNIVALVAANPVLVLTDEKKFDELFEEMRRETDSFEPDISTEKGRKAIASLAYKVARTKTAIDDAGKKLNEEARAQISAVDESRRVIRQRMDALRDQVRQPLTEWEDAEKERKAMVDRVMSSISELKIVDLDDTSETVAVRISYLEEIEITEETFCEMFGVAQNAKSEATSSLKSALDRLNREEAERAELQRLRDAEEERQKAEADRAAKQAEENRIAAAKKADEDRAARLKKEAEDQARQEAEAKALEESNRIAAEHEAALASERARADNAEKAAKAEADRLAKIEADRKVEADRIAAEQAARQEDRDHRSKIMGAAKEALIELGNIDEPTAKTVVLAIAAGNIPAVSINF